MNTQQLRYFIVAAQRQHMSEAAAFLHLSESALSRSITSLEREYGARLFDRVGRGVRLNECGRILLERVNRAFAELESGEREIRALVRSGNASVALGFIASLGALEVPKIVSAFVAMHGNIRLKLVEGSPRALREALVSGEIDVWIGTLPFPDPGIEWTELWHEKMLALLSDQHRLAKKRTLDLHDVAGERQILFKSAVTTRDTLIEHARSTGSSVNIVFESDNFATLVALVKAGYGVGLVPESLRDVSTGLRVVPVKSTTHRVIGLALPRFRESSSATLLLQTMILTQTAKGEIGPQRTTG